MRPYWGPGIGVVFFSSDHEYSFPADRITTGTTLETKNEGVGDGLTMGVYGVLGAEFLIYPKKLLR
ncbi:MAG TPA: hypothetical protein VK141_02525 [Nitrosomonas sp.]|nr:hypothetical protein [Nitrosomonas sp.]